MEKISVEASVENKDGFVKDLGDIEKAADQAAQGIDALAGSWEKLGAGSTEEKMCDEVMHNPAPLGATSFEELHAAQQADEAASEVHELTYQFQKMIGNIMLAPDIEDKASAIGSLAAEYTALVDQTMTASKERWQPLTDKAVTKLGELTKQKPMKTEGGVKFPAGDFAFVPDPDKPSTWKLRLAEGRPGNITKAQLGRAAAAFSPGGFRGQKVQIPTGEVSKVKAKIRAAYKKLGVKPDEIPDSIKEIAAFSVWKEDGVYRWLAIYSNNYRDDDRPPEILSKGAHLDFVRACDAGEWPYPELRLWHVKGSKWGRADFVAFDETTGFAVAGGTIDKGMEGIAAAVAERDYAVSHGMPATEIQRDGTDPTIITRFRSKEISPLPRWAAANKITGFKIQTEVQKDMTIPQHKKDELVALGFDMEALETQMQSGKEQAEAEERESKELETKDEPTEEAPQAEAPQLSVEELGAIVVAGIQAALEPIKEQLDAQAEQIKELAERDDAETEAVKEQLEMTPAASLASIISRGVIGDERAQVDGRVARHDAPKEVKSGPPVAMNSGSPLKDFIVNSILDPDNAWVEDLPRRQ